MSDLVKKPISHQKALQSSDLSPIKIIDHKSSNSDSSQIFRAGKLNPIESFEFSSDFPTSKQILTLNPLKEKEKVSLDPALLQPKNSSIKPIQAPAVLPPLLEEALASDEPGESLAERQGRLKLQRDLIIYQQKQERRKAVEKYLAEGGVDLASNVPVKLSQQELEKRRNIISKLKSFNESKN